MPTNSGEILLPQTSAARQPLHTITFQLPRDTFLVLRAAAANSRQSVSQLCRQAIVQYLDTSAPQR